MPSSHKSHLHFEPAVGVEQTQPGAMACFQVSPVLPVDGHRLADRQRAARKPVRLRDETGTIRVEDLPGVRLACFVGEAGPGVRAGFDLPDADGTIVGIQRGAGRSRGAVAGEVSPESGVADDKECRGEEAL